MRLVLKRLHYTSILDCMYLCVNICNMRLEHLISTIAVCHQGGNSTDQGSKDDDHSSTIVLCTAKDQFTLKQDMCLSCGSYGKGEEGKLIACVQCGQCYHPYCVNLKASDSVQWGVYVLLPFRSFLETLLTCDASVFTWEIFHCSELFYL